MATAAELAYKGRLGDLVRRVRTLAGVRKYGQPLGSIIVPDLEPDAAKPERTAAKEASLLGRKVRAKVSGSGVQWWVRKQTLTDRDIYSGVTKTGHRLQVGQVGKGKDAHWTAVVIGERYGFDTSLNPPTTHPGYVDEFKTPAEAMRYIETWAIELDKTKPYMPASRTVGRYTFKRVSPTEMATDVDGARVIARLDVINGWFRIYGQAGDHEVLLDDGVMSASRDIDVVLREAEAKARSLASLPRRDMKPTDYAAASRRMPAGTTWRDFSAGRRGIDWTSPNDPGMSGESDPSSLAVIVLNDARDLGFRVEQPFPPEALDALNEVLWTYHAMYPGFPRLLGKVKIDIKGSYDGTVAWNLTLPGRTQDDQGKPIKTELGFSPGMWLGQVHQYYDEAKQEWVDIKKGGQPPKGAQTRYKLAREAQGELTADQTDQGFWSGRWDMLGEDMPEWRRALIHTLHHELGHTVHDAGFYRAPKEIREEMMSLLESYAIGQRIVGMERPNAITDIFIFNADKVAVLLSKYGVTNLREFFAEVWTEYMTDPEPREFVARIGDVLAKGLTAYLARFGYDQAAIEAKRLGGLMDEHFYIEYKGGPRKVRTPNTWFLNGVALPPGTVIPPGAMLSPGKRTTPAAGAVRALGAVKPGKPVTPKPELDGDVIEKMDAAPAGTEYHAYVSVRDADGELTGAATHTWRKGADGRWYKGTIDRRGATAQDVLSQLDNPGANVTVDYHGFKRVFPFDGTLPNGKPRPGGQPVLPGGGKKPLEGRALHAATLRDSFGVVVLDTDEDAWVAEALEAAYRQGPGEDWSPADGGEARSASVKRRAASAANMVFARRRGKGGGTMGDVARGLAGGETNQYGEVRKLLAEAHKTRGLGYATRLRIAEADRYLDHGSPELAIRNLESIVDSLKPTAKARVERALAALGAARPAKPTSPVGGGPVKTPVRDLKPGMMVWTNIYGFDSKKKPSRLLTAELVEGGTGRKLMKVTIEGHPEPIFIAMNSAVFVHGASPEAAAKPAKPTAGPFRASADDVLKEMSWLIRNHGAEWGRHRDIIGAAEARKIIRGREGDDTIFETWAPVEVIELREAASRPKQRKMLARFGTAELDEIGEHLRIPDMDGTDEEKINKILNRLGQLPKGRSTPADFDVEDVTLLDRASKLSRADFEALPADEQVDIFQALDRLWFHDIAKSRKQVEELRDRFMPGRTVRYTRMSTTGPDHEARVKDLVIPAGVIADPKVLKSWGYWPASSGDPEPGDEAFVFARGAWRRGVVKKVTFKNVHVEYMTENDEIGMEQGKPYKSTVKVSPRDGEQGAWIRHPQTGTKPGHLSPAADQWPTQAGYVKRGDEVLAPLGGEREQWLTVLGLDDNFGMQPILWVQDRDGNLRWVETRYVKQSRSVSAPWYRVREDDGGRPMVVDGDRYVIERVTGNTDYQHTEEVRRVRGLGAAKRIADRMSGVAEREFRVRSTVAGSGAKTVTPSSSFTEEVSADQPELPIEVPARRPFTVTIPDDHLAMLERLEKDKIKTHGLSKDERALLRRLENDDYVAFENEDGPNQRARLTQVGRALLAAHRNPEGFRGSYSRPGLMRPAPLPVKLPKGWGLGERVVYATRDGKGERTGRVWSAAPRPGGRGYSEAVWVIDDDGSVVEVGILSNDGTGRELSRYAGPLRKTTAPPTFVRPNYATSERWRMAVMQHGVVAGALGTKLKEATQAFSAGQYDLALNKLQEIRQAGAKWGLLDTLEDVINNPTPGAMDWRSIDLPTFTGADLVLPMFLASSRDMTRTLTDSDIGGPAQVRQLRDQGFITMSGRDWRITDKGRERVRELISQMPVTEVGDFTSDAYLAQLRQRNDMEALILRPSFGGGSPSTEDKIRSLWTSLRELEVLSRTPDRKRAELLRQFLMRELLWQAAQARAAEKVHAATLELKQVLHGRVGGKARHVLDKAYLVRQRKGAEESKRTGAMIALLPSKGWAERFALPGAEKPEELHITLAYLGKANDWSYADRDKVVAKVRDAAESYGKMLLQAFGVSIFNPRTDNACLVMGIGGPNLAELHQRIWAGLNDLDHAVPKNHTPWVPHMTLSYLDNGGVLNRLSEAFERVGIVMFDRIGVVFGSQTFEVPLTGDKAATEAEAMASRETKAMHKLYVESTHDVKSYTGIIAEQAMRRAVQAPGEEKLIGAVLRGAVALARSKKVRKGVRKGYRAARTAYRAYRAGKRVHNYVQQRRNRSTT